MRLPKKKCPSCGSRRRYKSRRRKAYHSILLIAAYRCANCNKKYLYSRLANRSFK